MRKTIIEPGVGEQLEVFEGSDTVEGLAHSNGVAVELPGHTRIFLSGLVPIDDEENVIGPDDVGVQTREVLETIQGYVAEFGGTMDDVVRVRVYVDGVDDEEFVRIHEVRDEFFSREHYPASTLIEAELVIDEAMIEIDAEVLVPDDGWEVDTLE